MADFSPVTASVPEASYRTRQLAKATAEQNLLLERQVVASERIAAALEQAVEQLKGINHGTGAPDYVFDAINCIPTVLETYMIGIRNDLDGIGNMLGVVSKSVDEAATKRR